tara:strand:+ start:1246 stop:1461 length:216 start_codon:yes stop_codon:yes gene_type:complete
MKKKDKHKIYDIIEKMQASITRNADNPYIEPIVWGYLENLTFQIKEIVENDKCEFTSKEMADFAMNNPYEM